MPKLLSCVSNFRLHRNAEKIKIEGKEYFRFPFIADYENRYC